MHRWLILSFVVGACGGTQRGGGDRCASIAPHVYEASGKQHVMYGPTFINAIARTCRDMSWSDELLVCLERSRARGGDDLCEHAFQGRQRPRLDEAFELETPDPEPVAETPPTEEPAPPAPPAAPATPTARPASAAASGWSCYAYKMKTRSGRKPMYSCSQRCDNTSLAKMSIVSEITECSPVASVHCYAEGTSDRCFPTSSACEAQRASTNENRTTLVPACAEKR